MQIHADSCRNGISQSNGPSVAKGYTFTYIYIKIEQSMTEFRKSLRCPNLEAALFDIQIGWHDFVQTQQSKPSHEQVAVILKPKVSTLR